MSSNIKISVVVCTYNREKHIEKCIRSLFHQTLDRKYFEIIIINNASTDSTAELLNHFVDEPFLRVILEEKPGLSIARNRGWREARGQYIAYLDDDAVASEKWLESSCWAFENLLPVPQCLTGKITIAPETPIPGWITADLRVCLGYLDFSKKPTEIFTSTLTIIGANCHFTRSILEQTGGFNEDLGRKGTLLLSGEETQLQKLIESQGGAVWYHPDVAVTHFVAKERLTTTWFYRRYFWGGVSDIYMAKSEKKYSSKKIGDSSQKVRLIKNFFSALGFASKEEVIHGRIYMSYVVGYLYALLKRNWLTPIFRHLNQK